MSELMTPMSFKHLMCWAIDEFCGQKRVFGINASKFYHNQSGNAMEIFGRRIDSPIGPAAGPNSQLAQNIVAAFVAGSRFIELKTVQKMDGDELRTCVPRPCINAQDEGYNVEWSTELTVPQAFDEYVKAWIAVHVLCKELGISDRPGCVFNMSVGYDLEGIKGDKVNRYLDGMLDASNTAVWGESIGWLRDNAGKLKCFDRSDLDAIPAQVSNSVTLSTLHGCPPQEIERIAKYLLDEKRVHTFVKCNPTLLGYESARELLDSMGYHYISFDEHHFQNDLQYGDAVAMFRRLLVYAGKRELQFGVKITNTFPVQIKKKELPGEEMYMSGRSLFPLSIQVASRLATEFDGKLTISYSGGADAFNIADIFKLGIRPITVATTILKPGGYERLRQLADTLEPLMADAPRKINANALSAYVDGLAKNEFYRKEYRPVQSRKTDRTLGLFDCFMAPCKESGCPIQQQIPEYLRLVAQERYEEAFRVIAVDNAAPSVTGAICNHACQGKCTRMDYESPLAIRNAKYLAAKAAQEQYTAEIIPPALRTGRKVAVIGAGPAGIAAALYLRRNGVAVTVFEKRERPFGIVEYVIPAFRIQDADIRRDFRMAESMGAEFRFGEEAPSIAELKKSYDYVIVAVGAWKPCAPVVREGSDQLLDALAFLEQSKQRDCKVELGRRVAVIGGGDVAMDCARAAKRAPGVEAVSLVYRRTRDFMPAEPEEIRQAMKDGVEIQELSSPVRYDSGRLVCEVMELGEWDGSGRRSVSTTGETVMFPFDTVINATGARVDTGVYTQAGIPLDNRGRPEHNGEMETSLSGVYVAGDCKAGPSTVVSALSDAKTAAVSILNKLGLSHDFVRLPTEISQELLYSRKGVLTMPSQSNRDGDRCLGCDMLCELCCDVCPNRANIRMALPGFANSAQILHIDGLCNECGNCGTFCPYNGNPYKDKLTLYWSEEDFLDSENRGFLLLENDRVMIRAQDGKVSTLFTSELPEQWRTVYSAVKNEYQYLLP